MKYHVAFCRRPFVENGVVRHHEIRAWNEILT
jgi:hypothetical protein